jgi:5-methylcytosine-specific restriction endonuclease McrA
MLTFAEFEAQERLEYPQRMAARRKARIAKALRRGARKRGPAWAGAQPDVSLMRTDPCAYCGRPGETYDHIVPRYDGGKNSYDNVTRACLSCNARKNNRPLLLFLARRSA